MDVGMSAKAGALSNPEADGAYIVVKRVSRVFDGSDPLLMRLFLRGRKRCLMAVDNVSFVIQRGKTYALVGESGCGKSTLANMVVGLLPPSRGVIHIGGHDLFDRNIAEALHRRVRQSIQMIFQSPYASLNPRWQVGSILAEPIKAFGLINDRQQRRRRVLQLLEQVGLSASDSRRYPHEFSGGQRQRISIARALASQPSFIVCDEPTSALDVSIQAQVLNLLKQLQRELGLTYLFISHDLAVVRVMAHRIGVLQHGHLVEEQDARQLFQTPQSDHTKMLLAAAPKHYPRATPEAKALTTTQPPGVSRVC